MKNAPTKKTRASLNMKRARRFDKSSSAGDLLTIAARLGKAAEKAALAAGGRDMAKAILARQEDRPDNIVRAAQFMKAADVDVQGNNFAIAWGCYLIAHDRMETDPDLARISAAAKKKEKEYGLKEGEYWPRGEAPDDVEELNNKWERRTREIEAEVLREFGEDEMADALLADHDAFLKAYWEPGRADLCGPLDRGGRRVK
mgnify:FL=1